MIVLSIFLAVVFLFAGMTYVLYWYDTANGPGLENLRLRCQGRLALCVLQGFLWALIAQSLAVLTFPLGWLPDRKKDEEKGGENNPIIFTLHGLYHNRSAFFLVHRALKRAGFQDVRSWSYASWKTDFFQLSARLAHDLEAVHRLAPDHPILVIGHSLGGLLARHAITMLRPNTVTGCLTLGSPHQGSRLAVFALGKLGRSLAYRSSLIDKIEHDETYLADTGIACLALASPVDNMVLPMEALEPAGSHWQVRWTRPMSHVAMLYHPTMLQEIVLWVKQWGPKKNEASG